MKELFSFFSENTGFIIVIIAIACILFGRVWSNILNWGEITDPQLIIKKGKRYRVVNFYLPKAWTDDWVVGSIICLESYNRKLFIKYRKEIYVSGDRIRFADDGPGIGRFYEATFSNSSTSSIVMNPAKLPS